MIEREDQVIISAPVLVLVGPTAIGKTALSLLLSETFQCEIISVDSMQVYRYMDIGTAKVSVEVRQAVPHHLIDIVNPDEEYNAHTFAQDCLAAISDIHQRSAIPLLTGGTGLYLRSLKEGFFQSTPIDPKIREEILAEIEQKGSNVLHEEMSLYDQLSAQKIHPNDRSRIVRAVEVYRATGIPISSHQRNKAKRRSFKSMRTIGLTCGRPELYERINARTQKMVASGLEEEVAGLLEKGYGPELKSMQSLGYRHMTNVIVGKWSLQEMITQLAKDTRRYAKRQYTWFNNDDSIQWYDRDDSERVIAAVGRWLEAHSSSTDHTF